MERLATYVDEHRIRLFMFCLMTNHVHLLVETPQANLSAFMHKLQTAYTMYYNIRHDRVGHLMQGRFGARLVEGNEYLLRLSRYIHLNPVFADGMETKSFAERRALLRTYRWSSYMGYAGFAQPYEMVTEGPVLAMMETPEKNQRQAYCRFVEAAMANTDEEFLGVLRGFSLAIGGDDFQERIANLYVAAVRQAKRKEDVSFRHVLRPVAPSKILLLTSKHYGMQPKDICVRQYDCIARPVAAFLLGKYGGLNQRNIGEMLGMGSGSAVSRQLKRLHERRLNDESIARDMEGLEEAVGLAQMSNVKG